MPNEYYIPQNIPMDSERAVAETVAANLELVSVGFDSVPTSAQFASGRLGFATQKIPATLNKYELESEFTVPEGAEQTLKAGHRVEFFPVQTNTGASTLIWENLPEKDIKTRDNKDPASADIIAGWWVKLVYDGFAWRIVSPPPEEGVLILESTIPDVSVLTGDEISITLPRVLRGTGDITYSVTGEGSDLSFDSATRVLSGTISTAGTLSVTYTAEDSAATPLTLSTTFSITVSQSPLRLPSIDSIILTLGEEMDTETLPAAVGGTSPYIYALAGEPDGLSFDDSTRELTGTPTESGLVQASYTVTDSAATPASVTATVLISVVDPAGYQYLTMAESRAAADLTESVIQAGRLFDKSASSLVVPSFTGLRYIVISRPSSLPALTSIGLGLGNSISHFDRRVMARQIAGINYDLYVSMTDHGIALIGTSIIIKST